MKITLEHENPKVKDLVSALEEPLRRSVEASLVTTSVFQVGEVREPDWSLTTKIRPLLPSSLLLEK